MRKLLLPALAACSMLAVTAPVVSAHKARSVAVGTRLSEVRGAVIGLKKTVKALFQNDAGQKDAIHTVDGKVHTLGLTVQGILDGVPAIVNGLNQLKAGLTSLSTAVQGPGIAGQLGAAGTAAPGSSNSATPSTLPTGTVYRQIVLSTGAHGPFPAGTPIGARTFVKMPDVSGLYSNSWTCTGAGVNSTVAPAGATVDCSTNN